MKLITSFFWVGEGVRQLVEGETEPKKIISTSYSLQGAGE